MQTGASEPMKGKRRTGSASCVVRPCSSVGGLARLSTRSCFTTRRRSQHNKHAGSALPAGGILICLCLGYSCLGSGAALRALVGAPINPAGLLGGRLCKRRGGCAGWATQLRLRGGAADSEGVCGGKPSVGTPTVDLDQDPPATPPATRRVCFDEANLEANRRDVEVRVPTYMHARAHTCCIFWSHLAS